jgi:type I restriction enzyme S subunit
MANWKECRLGEVINLKRGFDLPTSKRMEGNFPIISSSGLSGWHSESQCQGPGVVTGRYGTIGQVFYVNNDYWPLNTSLYVEDFKGNHPKYIYYFLKTLDFQKYNDKSTVPGINRNHLHEETVIVPDHSTQISIAEILSSLDDKIELNNEINQKLEALAQALFKHWFIDFEFRNEKGEPYKSSGGEMVESELGRIPKGWTIRSIEEICEKVGMGPFGSNIKVDTFVEDGIPVLSGQHLKGTLVEDNEFNYITVQHADKLKNSMVSFGDVIFTHAGNIGQVAYLHSSEVHSKYILSQRQFYARPKKEITSGIFLTLFFKSDIGQHKLLANTSSTGVPSISRPVTYLRSIKLVVPSETIMALFTKTITNLYDMIVSNFNENKSLRSIRNIILPKLISGELEISESRLEKVN